MQGLQKDKPLGEWLHENLERDLDDRRSPWRDKIDRLGKLRLGMHKPNGLYPGAPNTVEPIIDENVRSVTSAENQIIWSSRQICNFVPMNPESTQLKAEAEIAFNSMLTYMLQIRAKLNAILDQKNDSGFAIAKTITNDVDYGRMMGTPGLLPDFERVEVFDFIVPMGTKLLRDAERLCHVMTYNERQLRKEGRDKGWDPQALKSIIKTCKQSDDDSDDEGHERRVSDMEAYSSEETYRIWECYYFTDDSEKRVCTFCPDAPEYILQNLPWTWYAVEPGTTETVPEIDPLSGQPLIDMFGMPVMKEVEVPAVERPWPFVQFRFEDRSDDFYDTRGISEMLRDNQNMATQFARLRAMGYDFWARPVFEGSRGAMETFGFRPGEMLPPGVRPVQMPSVDPSLSYSADVEKASAARRVGSQAGSLSSVDSTRDRKTATEVKQESFTTTLLGRDAIMRFSEPLGELFQQMWDFLVHNPVQLPKLTMRNRNMTNEGMAEDVIFKGIFSVQPAANSRAMNPDMILQQLIGVQPYIGMGQQAGIVRTDQLLKFVVDQINPQITDQIILDVGQTPLEQLVQQMGRQVQKNTQYIQAAAEEDMYADQLAQAQKEVQQSMPHSGEGTE